MIQFQNVSKLFRSGEIAAVNEISFTIDEGEFVFLIGPSGSGKTTLIEMLIRDVKPSQGKIYFDDVDITNINRNKVYKLRRQIGVIFQDFKLIPDKTAYENVAFAMEAAGRKTRDIKETVPYLLDVVGLEDRMKAFPKELSGGEQQRVAIARAMANNPRILIADEPTGNLDPASSWDIVQILAKINSWGTTVIMSTHGTDIVNTLNKRVIQMQKGLIVRDDSEGQYEFYDDSKDPIEQEKSEEKIIEKKAKKSSLKVNLTDKVSARSEIIENDLAKLHEPVTDTPEIHHPQAGDSEKTGLLSRFAFWKKDEVDEVIDKNILQNEDYQKKYDLDDVNIEKDQKSSSYAKASEDKEEVQEHEDSSAKPSRSLFVKLEANAVDEKPETKEEKKADKNEEHSDKELEELLNKTKKVNIEFLNLPGRIIKDLKKAGYENVGQIIEEGPESLADNLVIDPEEVILVAKAIDKVVKGN